MDGSAINFLNPVVFIVHGWTSSGSNPWTQNLTDSYLSGGDYNVIIADWRRIAAQNYFASVADLKSVGKF